MITGDPTDGGFYFEFVFPDGTSCTLLLDLLTQDLALAAYGRMKGVQMVFFFHIFQNTCLNTHALVAD